MHRFFVLRDEVHTPSPWNVGTELDLDETDAHHIFRVLRLKPGETVVLCDGHSFDYEARLVRVDKAVVRARVTSVHPSLTEPRLFLTLVQGVAKGGNMDLVVQKAVEIGVSRIIPVVTERTVVQLDDKRADSRVERWQRIAYEAAKQSRRGIVPFVQSIVDWTQLWRKDDLGHVFVPWEEEDGRGLLEAIEEAKPRPRSEERRPAVTVVIGPEGGLTPEEIDVARRHGAKPVTLGPRILRTETAAIVASALVLGAYGEMN